MKARAKRIETGDLIEGYYSYVSNNPLGTLYLITPHYGLPSEIDPTTIEYQIGDEWLSENEIAERISKVNRAEAYVAKWRKAFSNTLDRNSMLVELSNKQQEVKYPNHYALGWKDCYDYIVKMYERGGVNTTVDKRTEDVNTSVDR